MFFFTLRYLLYTKFGREYNYTIRLNSQTFLIRVNHTNSQLTIVSFPF